MVDDSPDSLEHDTAIDVPTSSPIAVTRMRDEVSPGRRFAASAPATGTGKMPSAR